MRRTALAWLVLLAVSGALSARSALAEPVDQARQRFEEGLQAARDGELERAIEAFAASYELRPFWGALVDLAAVQERAGRRPEAYRTYRSLVQRHAAELPRATLEQIEDRLSALGGELARVAVASDPPGATISIDGLDQGPAPLDEVALEPGRHLVEARLEGFGPASSELVLAAGLNPGLTLTLSLLEAPAPQVAPLEDPEAPVVQVSSAEPEEVAARSASGEPGARPRQGRRFWRGPWPWVIGTVVVLAATGVALGVTLGAGEEEIEADWRFQLP